MAEFKGTKGNWKISFMGNVIDEYGREIVNPENSQMREDEIGANAKLIAAAPELLAAALKALDECSDLVATNAGNLLEEAIKKATE